VCVHVLAENRIKVTYDSVTFTSVCKFLILICSVCSEDIDELKREKEKIEVELKKEVRKTLIMSTSVDFNVSCCLLCELIAFCHFWR